MAFAMSLVINTFSMSDNISNTRDRPNKRSDGATMATLHFLVAGVDPIFRA
jgi:hypothetical protein